MRILIDTDPGIDDSVALALAVRSPELEIAAITTTYGNTTVERATRNLLALRHNFSTNDKRAVFVFNVREELKETIFKEAVAL